MAEVDDILARLEHAKKTIIDLEKKKLDLTQEERRLKERYDEEELRFKTTVSDTTHNSDLSDIRMYTNCFPNMWGERNHSRLPFKSTLTHVCTHESL